ncbi:hypothetical protein GCM10022403_098770 [Streptomyces coacervatus]|uniref:Amino acid ABC transporter ATP-binding protein n=1 Tax=Streptomyces coacervatus TaxID=647381 RepID=A0ABP7JRU2_9ACTN
MAVDPLIELHDVNKYYGELHVLQDMTKVVVTHETGFARSAVGRVVFMADGRTVEDRAVQDRAPEEFFTAPRGERAKDFLSKILQH